MSFNPGVKVHEFPIQSRDDQHNEKEEEDMPYWRCEFEGEDSEELTDLRTYVKGSTSWIRTERRNAGNRNDVMK